MITINVDSKRNISVAEMKREQSENVVRLCRNCFAIMNDEEYRKHLEEKRTTFTKMDLAELYKIYNNDFAALDADMKQIKAAYKNMRIYKYQTLKNGDDKEVDITIERAKRILTREAFISGIVRAAFHWTSSRIAKDGSSVFFDCRKFFKD